MRYRIQVRHFIILLLAVSLLGAACLILSFRNSNRIVFKAATYNVHYFHSGWSGIQSTLKNLDADVVALQEVGFSRGSPVGTIARNLNYRYVISQPYVRHGQSYWVLAFLSRLPVLRSDEIRLGHSRRALRIVVDIQGQPVEFVTLHLTPLAGVGSDRQNIMRRSMHRKKELQDLFEWLGPASGPRVLLGDFNLLRGLPGFWMSEYEMLEEAGYADGDGSIFPSNHDTFPLPESTRQALAPIPSFLVPDSITLDYIFYSNLKVEETYTIDSDASDHWPLVGEFLVEPP
ncbi:MAG: endonuclease/exonuclease/phosphatase family protein [Leptospiraceae bacterium]